MPVGYILFSIWLVVIGVVLLIEGSRYASTLCATLSTSGVRRACHAAAETSVSEATWSTTTRRRAVSSDASAQSPAKPTSRCSGDRPQGIRELGQHLALLRVDRFARVRRHDVRGDDALEHGDLGSRLVGDDDVGREAGERALRMRLPGRADRLPREAADQLAGQVLEPREVAAAGVPGVDPGVEVVEAVEGRDEVVVVDLAADPDEHAVDELVVVRPGR